MCRLEIDWVYRANGPISLDESVPLRISLPLEGNRPQKDGEIVGKKSWTAVIKVEEDRLSFQGPISCNPRVATMAIAMTAHPGQAVYGSDGGR